MPRIILSSQLLHHPRGCSLTSGFLYNLQSIVHIHPRNKVTPQIIFQSLGESSMKETLFQSMRQATFFFSPKTENGRQKFARRQHKIVCKQHNPATQHSGFSSQSKDELFCLSGLQPAYNFRADCTFR